MRAVATQNRDAIALGDDTKVDIVENLIQLTQTILQGIPEPAAVATASTSTKHEFKCDSVD